MVPAKGWQRPELLDDGFSAFCSKATVILQHLISDDDTIMLTTSHKSNYSIEAWKNIFRKRDIQIKNLKTLVENVNHVSRKDEIVNWFKTHIVVDDFVIIDDDKSLNDLPEFLRQHLVQTNAYVGLAEGHAEMVKSILGMGEKAVL